MHEQEEYWYTHFSVEQVCAVRLEPHARPDIPTSNGMESVEPRVKIEKECVYRLTCSHPIRLMPLFSEILNLFVFATDEVTCLKNFTNGRKTHVSPEINVYFLLCFAVGLQNLTSYYCRPTQATIHHRVPTPHFDYLSRRNGFVAIIIYLPG